MPTQIHYGGYHKGIAPRFVVVVFLYFSIFFLFCIFVRCGFTQIVRADITNELHQDENSHQHRSSSINYLAFSSDSFPSDLWSFICTAINPGVFAADGGLGDSGHTLFHSPSHTASTDHSF